VVEGVEQRVEGCVAGGVAVERTVGELLAEEVGAWGEGDVVEDGQLGVLAGVEDVDGGPDVEDIAGRTGVCGSLPGDGGGKGGCGEQSGEHEDSSRGRVG
jgi:hypothetical protein